MGRPVGVRRRIARSPTLKLRTLLVLAASVAVVVALAFVSHRRRVDRAWTKMHLQLDELEAQRLMRSGLREALHGETTEGRAWPHYRKALSELDAIDDEVLQRASMASSSEDEDHIAERDAVLAELDVFFVHLRRGAQARNAARLAYRVMPEGVENEPLRGVRHASELAVARALDLVEAGDGVGAVEVLLDLQQLARDLSTSPIVVEELAGIMALAPRSLSEALERGAAHGMSVEAKTLWLEGLDALIAELPRSGAGYLGEVERIGRGFAHTYRDSDDHQWTPGNRNWPSWRHAFSFRASAAEFVDLSLENAAFIEEVESGNPTLITSRLSDRMMSSLSRANTVYASAAVTGLDTASHRYRHITRLALLRHALALDLGRAHEPRLEPYGDVARAEVTPERIRVWPRSEGSRSMWLMIDLAR